MDDLSLKETSRLQEIVEAAKGLDWEKFLSLTDDPFKNLIAMKEQFDDSSAAIAEARDKFDLEVVLKHHEDGTRLIFAKVLFSNKAKAPIILTLHSTSSSPESVISIWTFYQEINFG
ncbi:hypothetical protein [Rhizobium leguminosarum]|uniref:hypothetical protein n=1 Tax=Rhizobium leguminosarum TaxID=384 RepID=UPI003F9ABCFF